VILPSTETFSGQSTIEFDLSNIRTEIRKNENGHQRPKGLQQQTGFAHLQPGLQNGKHSTNTSLCCQPRGPQRGAAFTLTLVDNANQSLNHTTSVLQNPGPCSQGLNEEQPSQRRLFFEELE
jgi:hypothetical protein